MFRLLTLAFLFCLFHVSTALAYHIIGGEIYYTFKGYTPEGKFIYQITLKQYRNVDFHCGDIQGCIDNFENPVPVTIYTVNNTMAVTVLQLNIRDRRPLRDTLKNPCLAPRTQNLEVAFYQDTVSLDPREGGYYVVYQRCCRGQKLANIYDSEHEGTTYYTIIPGTESKPTNNSAYFDKDAAIVICGDMPFKYDYSGYDPDGDSLTYMMCSALTGSPTSRNEESSAKPPPYNATVRYIPPYSGDNPMGGSPTISIDQNGFLVGTPHQEGQYVVSVCLNEYDRRTKVLLGTHQKDILLTVYNCATKITANFPATLRNCVDEPDLSVPISNSSNAGFTSAYYWTFGDGKDTTTYSQTVFRHLYADSGLYNIKLVVNPGLPCTDSATGTVSNYPGLKSDFTATGICKGEAFHFKDQSTYTYGNIIAEHWDMGLGDDHPESYISGPEASYVYDKGGQYTVALTLYTDHDCTTTTTKDVMVYEVLPFAGNDTILTRGQPLTLHASGGTFYAWTPPDGLSNDTIPDPEVQRDQDISYVLKVSDEQGCVGYDTISIKYYTGPDLYVPNAFSPNGDGVNDRFRFIPVGITEYIYFRIYDRWGKLVYSSTDFTQGWDGTVNGKPASMDTYIWILEGKDFKGNIIDRRGTVTIVK